MPRMSVGGISLRYETCGASGPWVALSPGGRSGIERMQSLAQTIAASGYRVLLFDRRNCGLSDMVFDGSQSEYEHWADDLHAMLSNLSALPAFVGGSSSGCRLALLFALRYAQDVHGLLLWRVTGGAFAVEHLGADYYSRYIEAARQGGMARVCDTGHFMERIAERPENRGVLMAMSPLEFVDVMTRWRDNFLTWADAPVLGSRAADLASIMAPACVIPGNDRIHSRQTAESLHRLLPASELHIMYPEQQDVDYVPSEDWKPREREMAAIFTKFLDSVQRH